MTLDFARAVLPPEGHFCLWTKADRQHHWFDSIEAMVDASDAMAAEGVTDVYYGTAAFDTKQRKQAHVLAKSGFYIDLDAGADKLERHGADKVYASQNDALLGVRDFVAKTKLAPTYIVSSGAGLHLHFALAAPVDEARWTRVATKLQRVAAALGLKADAACTSDSARVLRLPGALHSNGNTVRVLKRLGVTQEIDAFEIALNAHLPANELAPAAGKYNLDINKDIGFEGPPKSIKRIATKCGALLRVAQLQGNVPEPEWRCMIGLAKHTVEGLKAAKAFSRGHPDYSPSETEAKFNNWKAGPTTCDEFSKHSSACATCKNRVKSPIVHGYMPDSEVAELPQEQQPVKEVVQPATGNPWDGHLPPNFFVKTESGRNVLYYRMPQESETSEGETYTSYRNIPITSDVFWLDQWTDAVGTEDIADVNLIKLTRNGTRLYPMSQALIASPTKLKEFLAGKSIHIKHHKQASSALEGYMKESIEAVKALKDMPRIEGRYGMFIAENGDLHCAHGIYVLSADGTIQRGVPTTDIREQINHFQLPIPPAFSGRWDASVWDAHVRPKAQRYVEFMQKSYNKPGLEMYRLAAMLGLASPLMAFANGLYTKGNMLPGGGLAVSLFSTKSGMGKTALMRMVGLAYGAPGEIVPDANNVNSTPIGRISRLSAHGTMPIGFDEMGSTQAASYAELISSIANGHGRTRADDKGNLRASKKFSLIALLGANKSARDMIAVHQGESDAIQRRLLELNVQTLPEPSQDEILQFEADRASVMDTVGALGGLIHLEMCKIGVNGLTTVMQKAYKKAVTESADADRTGRFQFAGMAAVFVLHGILRRLGLAMFDIEELFATFKAAYAECQSYVEANVAPTDGPSVLAMVLNDLLPRTVITKDITKRSGFVTKVDAPLNQPQTPVVARHVLDYGLTWVATDALRTALAERKLYAPHVIKECETMNIFVPVLPSMEGSVKSRRFNLFKGMAMDGGVYIPCHCIDVKRLAVVLGASSVGIMPDVGSVVQFPQKKDNPPEPPEEQQKAG